MPDDTTSPPSHGLNVDVLSLLRRDWQRHLRNLNRATNTQRIYDTVAQQFCAWLTEHQRPTDPRKIGKREIEDFMGYMTTTRSAATANVAYRALQQWFKWMIAEDEIERSPMERTTPPFVPEKIVPVLSIDQMRALLDSCQGREFVQVRDTAIIRLLLDSGGRLGEVSALTVDDVDFDMDVAHAIGKGRRPRALPFGTRPAPRLLATCEPGPASVTPAVPSCGSPKRTKAAHRLRPRLDRRAEARTSTRRA